MKETNNKKRSWKRLVTILSCMVVFCTTYALILPAVAQSKTYYCGKEEHTHSEECYHSSEPLCGKEVSEASEGHTHSEECYELVENKSLICGQEESELHVHDDSCYQVEQVQNLICGKEESEPVEGHTHSDDCYRSEEVLCGKEEHTHSRECESNKEDVEDPNSWNEAYKEIAKEEDAKKRILTVAKNELNYKENEANFEIDEEGKEHYYTRYGHFYEDKYGDWNNYFTGFVLNYANVQMNFDKDISKWQVKTVNDQNQEVGKEGNVVFFRDDEGELRSGILVEFNDLKNDVKIIQGDVDNRVQEVNVNKDKVIAYLDDEVKIEEEDTPLAGGEEKKEDLSNKSDHSGQLSSETTNPLISISGQDVEVKVGDEVILTANVDASLIDKVTSYQWQYNKNKEGNDSWHDLEGETSAELKILVSDSNKDYLWRVQVRGNTPNPENEEESIGGGVSEFAQNKLKLNAQLNFFNKDIETEEQEPNESEILGEATVTLNVYEAADRDVSNQNSTIDISKVESIFIEKEWTDWEEKDEVTVDLKYRENSTIEKNVKTDIQLSKQNKWKTEIKVGDLPDEYKKLLENNANNINNFFIEEKEIDSDYEFIQTYSLDIAKKTKYETKLTAATSITDGESYLITNTNVDSIMGSSPRNGSRDYNIDAITDFTNNNNVLTSDRDLSQYVWKAERKTSNQTIYYDFINKQEKYLECWDTDFKAGTTSYHQSSGSSYWKVTFNRSDTAIIQNGYNSQYITYENASFNLRQNTSDLKIWKAQTQRLEIDTPKFTVKNTANIEGETQENEIRINYNAGLYKQALINNKKIHSDIVDGNGNNNYTVAQPDQMKISEGTGNSLIAYEFEGWMVNDDENEIWKAGEWKSIENLEKVIKDNRNINLKAVWKGQRDKTVAFYVNLQLGKFEDYKDGDYGGAGDYLNAVHVTQLHSTDNNGQEVNINIDKTDSGNRLPIYLAYISDSEQVDLQTPAQVDEKIRELSGEKQLESLITGKNPNAVNVNYPTANFRLGSFPSDDSILEQVRIQQAERIKNDSNNAIKETVNGEKTVIPVEELTPNNFTIYWYVFKGGTDGAWHIDGTLVRKDAMLTVTKKFNGNAEAIATIKNGNFNIEVDLKNPSNNISSKKTLVLNNGTNGTLFPDREQTVYPISIDENTNTYTWVIPLKANETYTVQEKNYIADSTESAILNGESMGTVAQYAVTNSKNPTDGRLVYAKNTKIEIKSETYPKGLDYQHYQTVDLYNSYIPTNRLLITKVGDSGYPLANVRFQLYRLENGAEKLAEIYKDGENGIYNIYGGSGSPTPLNEIVTDENGQIQIKGLKSQEAAGEYILKEVEALPGYSKIDPIHLNVDADGKVSLKESHNFAIMDKSSNSLIVKNTSKTTSLTVEKIWAEGTTNKLPVKVVPVQNGHILYDKEMELKEGYWTCTWDNLPLNIGGQKAQYTVRETWIGSNHYDETADSDGYANYMVNVSDTISYEDGYKVTVRNALATNGFSFLKTGEKGGIAVLPGATFRISRKPEIPDNEAYRDATSDQNGIVNFGVLSAGIYYMKEIEAPEGYECSDQIYEVNVTGNSTTIKRYGDNESEILTSIPNSLAKANLTIKKIDNIKETPLAGAEFKLTKEDDSSFEKVFTSDGKGEIKITDLPSGKYTLTETKAPSGYNLLTKKYSFSVENGKITFDPQGGNYKEGILTIQNSRGEQLPNTGGTGTKLFTFSGGAIIAASSLMYGYKKRQKGKKKGGIQ